MVGGFLYYIFILNWPIKTENRHTVCERWANAALLQETPAGLRIKGRYHLIGDFTGVVVSKAGNEAAIFKWLLLWNDLVDVEYKLVVEDIEAQEIAKEFFRP